VPDRSYAVCIGSGGDEEISELTARCPLGAESPSGARLTGHFRSRLSRLFFLSPPILPRRQSRGRRTSVGKIRRRPFDHRGAASS
jgi:hypothetical protein